MIQPDFVVLASRSFLSMQLPTGWKKLKYEELDQYIEDNKSESLEMLSVLNLIDLISNLAIEFEEIYDLGVSA